MHAKNKLFFSGKCYREYMRQLRMMGIVLLSICILITALSLFISYMDWQNQLQSNPSENSVYSPFQGASGAFPALNLFMYIGGFLLPFSAFAFLDKRNASDFYHAVPLKRSCIFSTIFTACVSYILLTVVSTLVLSILFCLCTGMSFVLHDLIMAALTTALGAILMCAITSLASTLTGTRFSCFVVSMLILFLPRFILSVITWAAMRIGVILEPAASSFVLDASYNLLVAPVLLGFLGASGLTSMSIEMVYTRVTPMIYTAVLAIIYTGLACLMFVKRNSENAGVSAPNRVMQHVYRCLLTLPFMLICASLVFFDGSSNWQITLVIFVIALLVYFLYELITTKSAKRMLTCAPLFLAVVAVSFAILFGTKLIVNITVAKTVQAEDVKSISVISSNTTFNNEEDYNSLLTSQVALTQSDTIALVTNSLTQTVDEVTGKTDNRPEGHVLYPVRINLKNGSQLIRKIYIKNNDYDKLSKLLQNTQEYTDAKFALPQDNEIYTIRLRSTDAEKIPQTLDVTELWKAYRDEVNALSNDKKQALFENLYESNYQFESKYQFIVKGRVNGVLYQSMFSVNVEYTPNTIDTLIRLVNADTDKAAFTNTLDTINIEETGLTLTMTVQDPELSKSMGGISYIYYNGYSLTTGEYTDASTAWLESFNIFFKDNMTLATGVNDADICLNLSYFVRDEDGQFKDVIMSAYLTVNPESVDEFNALVRGGADSEVVEVVEVE